MSEFIAVDGLTLSHANGSPITGGVFTITSIPSSKVKIGGKGIYSGNLTFTFSGGSISGGDPSTVTTISPAIIQPTATKVKVGGMLVMREGDSVVMNVTYKISGTPSTSTGNVEISLAGQTKVKSN